MKVDFFDYSLKRVRTIFVWKSLLWETSYSSVGRFSLEIPINEYTDEILKSSKYLTTDEDDEVMIITSVQKEETAVVSGFTADFILSKRVSTNVVKETNAGDAMVGLVQEMTPWENFVADVNHGIEEEYDAQTSDGTILEYCEKISSYTDVGFKVVKNGNSLVFKPYKPNYNGLKLSSKYGNLLSQSFLYSEKEFANKAIVAGSGSGKERITVEVTSENVESGYDIREIYVDARNTTIEEGESNDEYEKRLEKIGLQKLSECSIIKKTDFEVGGQKMKLGDIVKIEMDFPENTITPYRIVKKTIKSQKNKFSVYYEVGLPIKRWWLGQFNSRKVI